MADTDTDAKIPRLAEALEAVGEEPSLARVDALNALAREVGFEDIERTASLGKEAVEIARAIDYPLGLAWGLVHSGYLDYASARYDAALDSANEAMSIFGALEDDAGIAQAQIGRGLIFWSLGDYELAITDLYASAQTHAKLGAHNDEAWALASLGGVYESIGDLDKSLEFLTRALERFRALDDEGGTSRALTGLAAIHRRQGRLDKALECSSKSLELADGHAPESRAHNDLGVIYCALGDYGRALEHLERALEMRRAMGNRSAEVTSLLDLGSLFLETGAVDDAIDHLELALESAEAAKTRPKIYRAHEGLARAHEAAGSFERALLHQRRFQEVKEEVLGEESATRLKNLQIRFEAEAHEQLKQAQAQLIQSEKMAALGKLVAGLAHELNSPVGVILSNADVMNRGLARITDRYSEDGLSQAIDALQQTQSASETAGRRIAKLVTSLRSFIRLDEAEFQLADVRDGIESTLSLLAPQWGERIEIVKQLDEIPKIEAYPTELNQALMTILANAGEAIDDEGTVTVATSHESGRVRIRASDTGRGISKERLERIFDVGFDKSGSRVRLHVGLANVQAVVAKHHGEIHVESEPGRGTMFDIRLPIRHVPA